MLLELLLASAPIAPAKVGPITLSEIVCLADIVVVARVCASEPVATAPSAGELVRQFHGSLEIGQLAVETWLKGAPTEQPLVFVNQGTWACDVTGAEVGERALYFLTREEAESGYQSHLVGYAERFGARPLHRVAHSGRGQMQLRTDIGSGLERVWLGGVGLPEDAPRDNSSDSELMHSLPFDWLKRQVAAEVQAQRAPWIELRARTGAEGEPWEFEVRGDRTATLRVATADGERRHELILSQRDWRQIRKCLRVVTSRRRSRDFGAAAEGRWARDVLVRSEYGVLAIRSSAPPPLSEPDFAAFDELWATLERALPDGAGMRFAERAK